MATVRVKGKKDTIDLIISKVKAAAPKKGEHGSIEITRTGTDILSKVKYVLQTGIRTFDYICGGKRLTGLPFGRIVEIFGLDASGKTALVLRSAVQAQLRNVFEVTDGGLRPIGDDVDVNILYIDNEQSLEDDEKIVIEGTTIDCALCRCDTVDQLFKVIDITINAIRGVQTETKRLQLTVVIVDTIAGTSSKEEMKQEWGKDDYNRQPKQLRAGFRQLMRKINRNNVLMICTNQVSDSFKPKAPGAKRPMTNVPQEEDFNTFGGRALKFYARLRVFIYKLRPYKLVKGTKFASGFVAGFVTIKNSQAKPVREGRMVLLYEGGLSDVFSLLEFLSYMKYAEVDDEGSYVFKGFRGMETKTFKAKSVLDLEEEEDSPKKKKSKELEPKISKYPVLKLRHEWPAFYQEHKIDFDALFDKCIEECFTIEGLNGLVVDEVEDEDEDDLGDVENDD